MSYQASNIPTLAGCTWAATPHCRESIHCCCGSRGTTSYSTKRDAGKFYRIYLQYVTICQHLYARVTGIILSASDGGASDALKAVLAVFQNDAGIQELMPYLSRFFYQQIKNNTKRLPLLYAIIRYVL